MISCYLMKYSKMHLTLTGKTESCKLNDLNQKTDNMDHVLSLLQQLLLIT